MAEMMDDIAHLSQEIGPRPAGTEEEQQAALYIADELQKSAGFSTIVEDVSCAPNGNAIRIICFPIAIVVSLVGLFVPLLSIPCFFICLLIAALFVCEAIAKPILSRFLRGGVSQNVVARYNPISIAAANKRRKIILITHYDSARVRTEYQGIVGRYLPIIRNAEAIAILATPLLLLIKAIFFMNDGGGIGIVFTVLQVVAILIMILPVASSIKTKVAPYNDAANNDASGVAVLLDVARKVGNGLVSAETMQQRAQARGVRVHGEAAAREAGVMPKATEVTYQARPHEAFASPDESLAAAKAAIAALTGMPVADKVPVADISSRLVRHGGLVDTAEDLAAAAPHFEVEREDEAPAYIPAPAPEEPQPSGPQTAAEATASPIMGASANMPVFERVESPAEDAETEEESFMRDSLDALQPGYTGAEGAYKKELPSWAKAAQEKAHANKPELDRSANVARSRFADAPAAQMVDAARRRGIEGESAAEALAKEQAAAAEAAALAAAEAAAEEAAATGAAAPTVVESELSKRLAELRNNIESAADEVVASRGGTPRAASSAAQQAQPAQSASSVGQAPAAKAAATSAAASTATPSTHTTTPGADIELVQEIHPHQQTPAEMIEFDAAASLARRRARRSVAPAPKSGIGGFLGRATDMVNSVSSKVAGLRGQEEYPEDDFHALGYEENIIRAGQSFNASEVLVGHTATMSQIDVLDLANQATGQMQAIQEEAIASEAAFVENAAAEAALEAAFDATYEAGLGAYAEEASALPPVAPIKGMEEITAVEPIVQREVVATENEDQADRHVIVLPDVIAPVANNMEAAKQRAPMDSGADATLPQASALLSNMLPQIGGEAFAVQNTAEVAALSASITEPGINLPDFSTGDFYQATLATSAFDAIGDMSIPSGTAGSTATFATVPSELAEDSAPGDFILDADDSVFEEGFTSTGAFAGPDYVEMPHSRVGRLFGKFGKKKKNQDDEISVREWVDVDSSYETRSVGRARGGWESFRQNEAYGEDSSSGADQFLDVAFYDDDDDFGNQSWGGRDWDGGAFSLQGLRDRVSGSNQHVIEEDFGAPTGVNPYAGQALRDLSEEVKITEEINNEIRMMRDFRHPDINTEVWFVALGAEEALNSGMYAFIDEHRDELKGAIIINLEGVGAGQFSFIDEEGQYQPTKVSSRMKRLLRQASERSRVPFETSKLLSRNTAAHIAALKGFQALTLAGMDENGQTAYYASINDTIDVVEPAMLEQSSRFVLELLKSV